MWEYARFDDDTQVSCSSVRDDDTVLVVIERPRDWGFDTAKCLLPARSWVDIDGFGEADLAEFDAFVRDNAPLIMRFAYEGSHWKIAERRGVQMTDVVSNQGPKHEKRMLSPAEQIEHLKAKGIKFEKCTEEEAADYLSRKCNFFKVASYRKLFAKYQGGRNDGKYIDLDFAQLKLLASLDQQLRGTLLAMALDLEHFQKVALVSKMECRADEDGYSIVCDYLDSLDEDTRKYKEGELKTSGYSPYSQELYLKYKDDMPAWAFLELTSFGTLIDFVQFCGIRWGDRALKSSHYDYKRVKSIRNSCAHGSCLINSFASKVTMNRTASQRVLEAVSQSGVSRTVRKRRMSNPAMQEITTVLVLYAGIVPEGESRKRALAGLKGLFARIDEAGELLPSQGPSSTAMATFSFIRGLTDSLGLLK